MHIYEYLFAALIVIVILVASSTIAITMPSAQLGASDKEQVKIATEKIITQILLDPGQPFDWGSNIGISKQELQAFGLAKYGESTREAYTLDPDKVQRLGLEPTDPLYIPPSVAANLLNLNSTADQLSLTNNYGFFLEIHPILNITVSPPTNNIYNVAITSEYQVTPVVNARVNATLFYNTLSTIYTTSASNVTGFDGRCQLQFPNSQTGIIAVSASYLGIRTVQIFDFGNNLKANLLGNNLLLNPAYSISNSNITEIIATQQSDQVVISDFNSSATYGSGSYKMSFIEPSAFAVIAPLVDGSRLVFAARNINVAYSTIPNIATSISYPLLSYSLERIITVGETACSVRLLVWRMSY